MDRRIALATCLVAVVCLGLPSAASATVTWGGSYVRIAGPQYTKTAMIDVEFYGTCTHDGYTTSELLPVIDGDVALTSWASVPVDQSGVVEGNGTITTWVSGIAEDVPLTLGDGGKRVDMRFFGPKDFSPTFSATVILDTTGPKTIAPYRLTAKKGGYATVSYQADDALSPTADVSLQLRSPAGKKLKTIALGEQETGKLLTHLLKVTLAKGTYKYAVLATDLAGNTAAKVGANSLIVR